MPRKGDSRPLIERLMEKVRAEENGCWAWTACRDRKGYGKIADSELRIMLAHRVSYELHVGPIPPGLQLDHLCRNHSCVNPAHLEPVTARENTMRGMGPAAVNAAKTHCIHGHPLSGDNVRVESKRRPSGGTQRKCLTCERNRRAKVRP